ncbi:TetR/AcrR family transcriptional regulator [Agromyces seonyuensis]|uniref:TetR family transcriptional regulator n=1 Tax=Agromyces seonyuensis TaxID=2662446 RepID=A0A6I4P3K4_9MICO|nr:TetR/AcrR family transcriptional regulator [Agromyces seonyuensis]MWC00293.1 TetR family transcriptional regulator [Agromyces seonyuensis]
MAARGPYAKGVAKRAEILETALDVIARNGYSGATVREIADAVGLSQNGLLHYFGSKDALFTEILRRRDEVDDLAYGLRTGDDEAQLTEAMSALVTHNASVPGLVQLYARLSNEASEPGHPSHEYFRERYRSIRSLGTEVFARLQAEGRVRDDLDPAELGMLLFALLDGMQTQWMYDPESVDMAGAIDRFIALMAPAHR